MFITEYVRRSSVNRILGYLFFRPPPPSPTATPVTAGIFCYAIFILPRVRADGKKRLPVPVGTPVRTAVSAMGTKTSRSHRSQSLAVGTEDLASCYGLGRTTYDDVGDLWVRSSKIKKKK